MRFGEYEPAKRSGGEGWMDRWVIAFPNGYGASIIRGTHSFGFFEVAVLKDDDLCYDTPVTDDVIGWLDAEAVAAVLEQIEALSEEGTT